MSSVSSKDKTRKSSTSLQELDDLCEQELKDLYKQPANKFEPPEPSELETIFEPVEGAIKRSRRGMAEDGGGGLVLGQYKSRRLLEAPKYWLEDKAKTRHRAKMTSKSGKGKKRFRVKGLTEEQEQKLSQLIETAENERKREEEERGPSSTPSATPSSSSKASSSTPRVPLIQVHMCCNL